MEWFESRSKDQTLHRQTTGWAVSNSRKVTWDSSLSNHTIIQQTTTIQSVTDTTSTFTQ